MHHSALTDQALREKFAAVKGLTNDWDGAGAVAPSAEVLASTEHVLQQLGDRKWPSPHRVFALSSGEIVLEWDNGPNHFEVEIAGPHKLTWMKTLSGDAPVHGADLDMEAAVHLVQVIGTEQFTGLEVSAGRSQIAKLRGPTDAPSEADILAFVDTLREWELKLSTANALRGKLELHEK